MPNSANADIPDLKLTGYLLSETHPDGMAKARLLRSAGYNQRNSDTLKQDLLAIARNGLVTDVISNEYGTKYVVDGELNSPDGIVLQMRTIWIVAVGQVRPRLVTLYPR